MSALLSVLLIKSNGCKLVSAIFSTIDILFYHRMIQIRTKICFNFLNIVYADPIYAAK